MPSQKQKSKEDTWTPDELNRALNKTGERQHHRDRDEDRKRDRINGEDKHRRHRDDDSERKRRHRDEDEDRGQRLTEEERERQREERRRKREGKDGGKDKKGKEIQFRGKSDNREIELNDINDEPDDRRRHHRSDRDRERRHHEDDERERRHHDRERRHRDEDEERPRRHKDDDNDRDKRRRHKDDDDDRRRRHRDDDDREKRRKPRDEDEEDERERRRQERRLERERQEEEDRRRRHAEKKGRRKDDERRRDDDRRREKDDDRRRDRDKEKDRDRNKDKKRESEQERKEREREERRREREERHREKDEKKSSSRQKQEEPKQEEEQEEDEYNYEEDFEDYDDDFEDDDDEGDVAAGGSGRNVQDSEVNDVLRALDAENERLLNSSSRSPQVSANYGRRGGDEDSGPDSDDDYKQTYQPRQNRPRTAINFVSAKQRAVSKKTASKTMQRGKDLLAMLDLDFASFDMMDLPPVNEYDLYIRAFGSSDTRQAYVQTNEDNADRDIQTEEIDVRQKWTQHPPEDFKGYGRGDGEKDMEDEEESQNKFNKEQDLSRLNKFLEKAGQVIAILLEEDKEEEMGSKTQKQTDISTSEGYTQLDLLPILHGRHVMYTHFSPVQPNLLLTVYCPAPEVHEDNPVSKRGVICVWNTNDPLLPQKILVCTSQPRCCCFSPVKPSLVFAGMLDGSIAMWDLREPTSIHRPTVVNEESYSLRYPTYDTACVLKEENHHSPVSTIVPIYTYTNTSKSDSKKAHATEETSSGLSFQLVSTEESAVLHFWVVAEIGAPDIAGSETDLGLAPGAGVKLLKSSSLTLNTPSNVFDNKDVLQTATVRANDMALIPNDPNHFYVATDAGSIIHGIRFGKRTFPRAHSAVIETVVDVVSIDFSPFDQPCFLAGCSDGTFSIYHTKIEKPLISWPHVTQGRGVQCVRWSRCRPCVFYILDTASTLYVFDLLEGDMKPKTVECISKERVTSFSLTNVERPDGYGTAIKDAQMLFSFETGRTEVHTIAKSLRTPENLEDEYLGSYLQRF